VGRQDRLRGETIAAFIVLEAAAELTKADVITHCREHLAQYKVPRTVSFVDSLPKNPPGKVLRKKLKDE
ncbi:MAG: long-chain fatty acid--CoA ligase, partial [Proteobacteria bacterium]|nr:long-chain fatty acid--CoA ligase [Pseudomonadota bacterium]MBU1743043.1 long-chain fatty acid--CoA ligase [Pseudomonadota bacterium]